MSEEEKRAGRAELQERVLRLLPMGATALIAVLTVAVGLIFGPGFGVLVLAVGAMLAAIAALWHSIRALFGETPLSREDAFAIGAPSAEEEQKRAVLRAIKDLEFEHSVGKISREDYESLVARYRAEAKRLLRQIDEDASPERERIERMVASHLRAQGIEPGWLESKPADNEPAGIEPAETERAENKPAENKPVERADSDEAPPGGDDEAEERAESEPAEAPSSGGDVEQSATEVEEERA